MVREIPKDREWDFLRSKLRIIASQSVDLNPKLVQSRWDLVARALEANLGDPTEEWKRKIASIFAGRNSI
jgi:hypothetical protein